MKLANGLQSRQFSYPPWAMQRRRSVAPALSLAILVLSLACAVHAQQRNYDASNTSGLAKQNLNLVAASAAEIKAVLVKDTGLMVELKRWIAKDATDHGQILGDSDLTDDAVFARLERDVPLRSAATLLLQKYGYLVPKVNPESDFAREQALLIQERAKWIAQDEEEERVQARRNGSEEKRDVACESEAQQESRAPHDCGAQPRIPSLLQTPMQQNPSQPFSGSPGLPSDRNNGITSPEQEQLLRTSAESPSYLTSTDDYFPTAPGSASPKSISLQTGGDSPNRRLRSAMAEVNPASGGAADELLAQFGLGTGIGAGLDASAAPSLGANLSGGPALGLPTSSDSASEVTASPAPAPARRYQPEPALMTRKPMPYKDVPSLYDMYIQAVAHPTAPRRFGTEVFENGTRDAQLIPMDLPVGPDYVIGPGDGLSVDLWGGISQRLYRAVDREGRISLPEAGPVLVSGKSLAAAQQDIQQILRTQFRDVSVDVSLSRLRTIRVYEVGDVANPGAYDISSLSTPLNALFAAGGPTQRGSMRILKHYRGNQLVQNVDLYDLLLQGVKTDLKRLENGDTIQVPPIGPQITIEGMVRRPAIYELRDEKNLAAVLDLAGGLLPVATLRHIEVQRLIAHQNQTMLSLDIPETDDSSEITKKLENFDIHEGDRIRIFPIAPYNQDTVYVEGHAIRPGRYSYHANMRVTDVISSYKDLLPEPATQYAEIIRLNPPDFHPSVQSFSLHEALANPSQAPVLQPLDTVRIFSRFDFEAPPAVYVGGEVRAPGAYETPGQIHLADAIHLAGGLTPSAQTDDVQVFRYLPDGNVSVSSMNLSRALAGDPVENIVLQPRDRLLIHSNPSEVAPPSVYAAGEVARPGRYPLPTNMRVADLIRVAGGLTLSADTQTADVTRYEWTDHQTKLDGKQESVALSSALAGDPSANVTLHNGDVLTIRQIPGWSDLGASVSVSGEVNHPGTYGVRPGERLSSILARAGGFRPTAYPRGIVLLREDVRQLERHDRDELILRIREEGATFKTSIQTTGQDQVALAQAEEMQRARLIEALQRAPVTGRLVVRMPNDLARFRGSPDDIEVRRGDTIIIPKKLEFVAVTGQVYSSNAVTYRPGHNAGWYLRQAGGVTEQGNQKATFIIRANGSIVSSQGHELFVGSVLSTNIEPGDTIVVPEKPIGGSSAAWKNVVSVAQVAQAAALTAFVVAH